MSFFLLDLKMAIDTNLISKEEEDCIHDIYDSMLHELNNYIKEKNGLKNKSSLVTINIHSID